MASSAVTFVLRFVTIRALLQNVTGRTRAHREQGDLYSFLYEADKRQFGTWKKYFILVYFDYSYKQKQRTYYYYYLVT